ncbi:ABC transporter permease [Hyphomonas johnsonii]|uniref:ABC transporter permease n=1 Tax=Hyphomonas johnsonii MHS-2 TaxID=1280950 RepID=A0A059FAG7_9PROT|nr:iron ABC transporter permease [Hyphomonas johnsonii]KCZ87614.1 ABC transporter permease [Hyphomonas johnsonii MHS-2]
MAGLPSLRGLTFKASDGPAFVAGLVIAVPVVSTLIAGAIFGGGDVWIHIRDTLLAGYVAGSLGTLALAGLLMLAFAVPTAWLVTMYRFPGRAVFEWLLILPLAAPGYVLAYAYGDLLGVGGPIQSALRNATGLAARDYWFPDVHSLPGLAFILALTLYPYVYLTARAAFISQSVCSLEAARSLGASAARSFWQVALPAARPAIAAGLALALMEAAADYGAAEYLGVPTLTFGIVRAWTSFGEPATAARLALILLGVVLALILFERWSRGRRGSQQSSRRWRQVARAPLAPPLALAATALCATLFLAAFGLPVGRLLWRSLEARETIAPIWDALRNTLVLAGAGAALAFVLALIVALSLRASGPLVQFARLAASSGYAIPGAVLAMGALVVLGLLPFTLTGASALIALAWVYASRFTAAGAEPMVAALARAPASLGQAASSLGASPYRRAREVDLPIALSGATAGALILFVEALKELPATLMLRPFNWDTLAVRAHAYAVDERLAAAALPALLITLAGLVPVIFLSWRLSRARPGGAA